MLAGGRGRRSVAILAAILVLALAWPPAAGAQDPNDGGGPATTLPTPPPPAAWVLVDADTGAVLEAHDDRTPFLPASTIKLFTALVAVQRLAPGTGVPISLLAEGMPARKINVKAGQSWTVEHLLHSMLMVSANDAAVALAEAVGGGTLAGWEQVAGETAARLGLADAPDLSDPAGLDDHFSNGEGSRISARDLAIVARAFLAEPALASVAVTDEYRFDGGDGLPHRLTNHNRFVDLYPGAIGLKTGLTERAGRCFVAAATRGGRTMIAVLFDAPDIYASAAHLIDRGFAVPVEAQAGMDHLPPVVPGAALDPPARIPGALDVRITAASGGADGIDWNSPRVAAIVAVLGVLPLLALRRPQD